MLVEKKLEVGDFITVLNWKTVRDNSYKGDCMEVLVIDLPVLRVKRHTRYSVLDDITLNTDQVNIKILSKAFVANVLDNDVPTPLDTKSKLSSIEFNTMALLITISAHILILKHHDEKVLSDKASTQLQMVKEATNVLGAILDKECDTFSE